MKQKQIEKIEGLLQTYVGISGEVTFANDYNIQQLWEKINILIDEVNKLKK